MKEELTIKGYIEEDDKRREEVENWANDNSEDENDDEHTMRGFYRCEEC